MTSFDLPVIDVFEIGDIDKFNASNILEDLTPWKDYDKTN